MRKEISIYTISPLLTIKEAMEKINLFLAGSTLFVVNEYNVVLGTVTDGDIRRGILNGISILDKVDSVMQKSFKFLINGSYYNDKLEEFKNKNINMIPLLDSQNKLLKVYDLTKLNSILPIDAVIMAGGRGERLKPLTDSIPKPLLRIGSKPIIEHNIDRLIFNGIDHFHISVNYLGNLIKDYFEDGINKEIVIKYIDEEKPMGTIGAVSKIGNSIKNDNVLLMNSDLLTNIDYADFYKKFIESEADMIVATIPYHVDVPYAVMEINKSEEVVSFKEKPRYTYYSNAGIYLFKKELINLIPTNEKFDATHFMEKIIAEKKKLISYPVLGYWLDIGRMDDYYKAQEDIKHLKM
ncbi:MAG: nucleotidyltransferase family protein [Bacteroidota bacterium]